MLIANSFAVRDYWQHDGMQVFENIDSMSMLGTGLTGRGYVTIQRQTVYQEGDIVAFRGTSCNVLHEVIAVRSDALYTKGTFNATGDGWIPLSDIHGKLVTFYKLKR